MKKSKRYKVVGLEIQHEPNASGKVPKNLLAIKNQPELDRIENITLKQAEDKFQKIIHQNKHFTARNIRNMHTEVHVEIILIHPFREGNGRLSRALSTLMALQAGLPPLDFSPIEKGKKKQDYFRAIRSGWDKNYEPMKDIFREIIEKGPSRSQEKRK